MPATGGAVARGDQRGVGEDVEDLHVADEHASAAVEDLTRGWPAA